MPRLGRAQPFPPIIKRLPLTSTVFVFTHDGGSLAENPTIGIAPTDAGTLIDTPSIGITDTDYAQPADASTLSAAVAPNDPAKLAEATSIAATLASNEAGTLKDGDRISIGTQATEGGTLAESTATATTVKAAESGKMGDLGSLAATVSPNQAGRLAELATIAGTTVASDASTETDAIRIGLNVADAGTTLDNAGAGSALIPPVTKLVHDAFLLGELASVAVTVAANEPGRLSENAKAAASVTSSDAGTLGDADRISIGSQAQEGGTLGETVGSIAAAVSTYDAGKLAEPLTLQAKVAGLETGKEGECTRVSGMLTGAEAGTLTDAAGMGTSAADAGTLADVGASTVAHIQVVEKRDGMGTNLGENVTIAAAVTAPDAAVVGEDPDISVVLPTWDTIFLLWDYSYQLNIIWAPVAIRTDFTVPKGVDRLLVFVVESPPQNIQNWNLLWTVKGLPGPSQDPQTMPVLLSKTNSSGITLTDIVNGSFAVTLASADTLTTLGIGAFRWDVWRTDTNQQDALAWGILTVVDPARW